MRSLQHLLTRRCAATIQRARLNRLTTLFNITHDMIHEMSGRNACKQPGLPHVHQYKCTAQNHLGIHRYLRLHGLNPLLTSVASVRFSAYRLMEILTDPLLTRCMWRADAPTLANIQASIQNPLSLEIEVHNRHATCLLEVELKRRITEAMKIQPFAARASTINDIRRNAGKEWILIGPVPANRSCRQDGQVPERHIPCGKNDQDGLG